MNSSVSPKMGFTIVAPINKTKNDNGGFYNSNFCGNGCKEFAFKNGRVHNVTQFGSYIQPALEQPLHSAEASEILKTLEATLNEIDEHDEDEAFLIAGEASFITDKNGTYFSGLTTDWIEDAYLQLFLWDLDGEDPRITAGSTLDERIDVIYDLYPELKGKAVLFRLSSSAGFSEVWQGDTSKNKEHCLNVHAFVRLDSPKTCEELKNYLGTYYDSSELDISVLEPTKRIYVKTPTLAKDPEHNALAGQPRSRLVEGDSFRLEDIPNYREKKHFTNSSSGKSSSSKKTSGTSNSNAEGWAAINDVIRYSKRDELFVELEKLPEKFFKGNRNQMRLGLFDREGIIGFPDFGFIVEGILSSPKIRGDATHSVLKGNIKHQKKKVIESLNNDCKRLRKEIFQANVFNFSCVDMTKEEATIDGRPLYKKLLDTRLSAVKSPCGSGKTKGVVKPIVDQARLDGKRVLYVSSNKSDVVKAASDLGITNYIQNGEQPTVKERTILGNELLAICHRSLTYFEAIDARFDIIIIDEAASVIRGWSEPEEAKAAIHQLMRICRKADNVMMFDAEFDDEICSWFFTRLADSEALDTALYINNAERAQGSTVTIGKKLGSQLRYAIDALEAGKKIFWITDYSDENLWLTTLGVFLQSRVKSRDIKFKAFDREPTDEKVELELNPNETIHRWMQQGELDLLILSPWCIKGWDFYHPESEFDMTFISTGQGWFGAKMHYQMSRRARTVKDINLFVYQNKKTTFKREELRDIQIHKNIKLNKLSDIDQWELRANEACKFDKADIYNHTISKFQEKGMIVSEYEYLDSDYDLHEELDEFRESYKKAIGFSISKKTETIHRIGEFFVSPKEYIDSDISEWGAVNIYDIEDNKYKKLKRGLDKIDTAKARKVTEWLSMTEDERRDYDAKHMIQTSLVVGHIIDSIIGTLDVTIEKSEKYKSFFEWCLFDRKGKILINLDSIDTDPIVEALNGRTRTYKRYFDNIPNNAEKEPYRAIVPLLRSIGINAKFLADNDKKEALKNLRESTFPELDSKEKITLPMIKKKLYEYYGSIDIGFPSKSSDKVKRNFCLDTVNRVDRDLSDIEYLFKVHQAHTLLIYRGYELPKSLVNAMLTVVTRGTEIRAIGVQEQYLQQKIKNESSLLGEVVKKFENTSESALEDI